MHIFIMASLDVTLIAFVMEDDVVPPKELYIVYTVGYECVK